MRYEYRWKDADYELFIPLHEIEESDQEMVNTVAASAMDAIGLFDALGMDHAKALVLFLELLCEMDRTTGHVIRPSAQEMVDAIARDCLDPAIPPVDVRIAQQREVDAEFRSMYPEDAR